MRAYYFIPAKPTKSTSILSEFPVTPAKGDCSLYLEHIKSNICKCDEDLYAYILDWMADAIRSHKTSGCSFGH